MSRAHWHWTCSRAPCQRARAEPVWLSDRSGQLPADTGYRPGSCPTGRIASGVSAAKHLKPLNPKPIGALELTEDVRDLMRDVLAVEAVPHYWEIAEGELVKLGR
ncbi:DUF2379 family protein [Stigmatella aurantiaca]|uniref:DUF2379 family protein n=1 Tax=Stigmatella aurantiaca TaxID=41 RepID=UPI0011D29332